MKNKQNLKIILNVLSIILVLIVLAIFKFSKEKIAKTNNNYKAEDDNLFTYEVVDNQDNNAIKCLVIVSDNDGIEYVENSNGQKINANGRTTIAMDVTTPLNQENIYQIKKLNNNDIVEETLKVTQEKIDSYFDIESVYDKEKQRSKYQVTSPLKEKETLQIKTARKDEWRNYTENYFSNFKDLTDVAENNAFKYSGDAKITARKVDEAGNIVVSSERNLQIKSDFNLSGETEYFDYLTKYNYALEDSYISGGVTDSREGSYSIDFHSMKIGAPYHGATPTGYFDLPESAIGLKTLNKIKVDFQLETVWQTLNHSWAKAQLIITYKDGTTESTETPTQTLETATKNYLLEITPDATKEIANIRMQISGHRDWSANVGTVKNIYLTYYSSPKIVIGEVQKESDGTYSFPNFIINSATGKKLSNVIIQFASEINSADKLTIEKINNTTITSSNTLISIDAANIDAATLQQEIRDKLRASLASVGTRKISIKAGVSNEKIEKAVPYYSGTNHYYEFVSSAGIHWGDAKKEAERMYYIGKQGYLATITSEGEQKFVASLISGEGWLGGTCDYRYIFDKNGNQIYKNINESLWHWYWATGPESGEALTYTNWNSGEPNNYGNEYFLHMLTSYKWNDYNESNSSIKGYIVEYGGMPNDTDTIDTVSSDVITINIE